MSNRRSNPVVADAIDFDDETYVNSIKDIGVSAVLLSMGRIVANHYNEMEFYFRNPGFSVGTCRFHVVY